MLRQWLETQGYLKSASSSAADVSHLFLDGGIACVPDEMTGAFNNLYALCLHKKEDMLFVVEKKTPVFRMFFDLDMRTERPLDDEAILEFSRDIRAAVAEFYGDASLTTTVCLADSSNWDPKTRSWKTGAHLIWPDVATVSADALRCRDHVLDALKKKDATKFTTPLETVIDRCVLEKNGMRMMGSHKLVPCGACGSSSGRPCPTCGGRKKVVQRGVYWPRYVVQPDGFPIVPIPEIETLRDMRRWTNDTSLRVAVRPRQVAAAAQRSEADEEILLMGGDASSSLKRIPMDSVFRDGLEAFAKTLPAQFGNFRFTAMYHGGKGDDGKGDDGDDKVFIARTTSRFCMNLGRCHRSNNVYFLFSERGAYQMCFCRCQTTEGRKHGLCENFHGPAFPISPPELKIAMFGPSRSDERIRPAPPLKTVISREYEALMRSMLKK